MSNKKFDLTYLSIDSVQEGVGSSQITPMILGLSKRGKSVCLITLEKTKPAEELLDTFESAGVEWIIKDFGKPGILGGIKRLNTLRRSVPDSLLLHGRSDVATAAAIWSRVKVPVLWDVRSFWSDQRLAIRTAGWNRLIAQGARMLENVAAKKSMAMSTLTYAAIPILKQRHTRIPDIREVIPTCVQTTEFTSSPMPKNPLTCLLSGTFNDYYDLDRTKQILDEIRRSVDLQVVWARPSESPSKNLGVGENLIVTASYSDMPKLVKGSHFGIAICKENQSVSLAASAPTKIGEFLASGRPVIVSSGLGDFDQMLRSSGAGLVIASGDSLEGLAQRVDQLISDSQTPDRCRTLAMLHFDMEEALNRYEHMYDQMLELV